MRTRSVLSDRANIVVIADEAHRTQYGFSASLKAPGKVAEGLRAIRSGMHSTCATRCPTRRSWPGYRYARISGRPRHCAVFGDYIHVYDMQQAKDDGATVAIYYESRFWPSCHLITKSFPHRRRSG